MPYPLPVLELFFTANEIARGKAYYSAGRVSNVRVEAGDYGYDLTAMVQGSDFVPYKQDITIFVGDDSEVWEDVDIEGECTCPVGFNCKHVAAVLFSAEKKILPAGNSIAAQRKEGSFDQWLQKTVASKRQLDGQTTEPSNQLVVYELHISTFNQPENQLSVQVVKTRSLKSGELSKAQSAQVHLFNVAGTEKYLRPEDIEIISALQICARDQVNRIGFLYQGARLCGRIGAIVLEQLLATERFYLGDYRDDKLLRLAGSRPAAFSWCQDASGSQKIRLNAECLVPHIFDVNPVMGLDIQGLAIFPMEIDLDRKQIFQFFAAPTIGPEQSTAITDKQRDAIATLGIPLPAAIHTRDVPIETRQPVLKLGTAKNLAGKPCEGGYAMTPWISYNGAEALAIPGTEQIVSRYQDGVLERSTRDFDYEQQLADYLTQQVGARDLSTFFLGRVPAPGYYGFENSADWYEFLENGVQALQENGWSVVKEDEFDLVFDEVDAWHADIEYGDKSDWFDIALGIEVAGERIQLLPILLDYFKGRRFTDALEALMQRPDGKQPVSLGNGKHLLLPNERLIPLLETFVELFDQDTALKDGSLQISRSQELRLLSVVDQNWLWQNGKQGGALRQRLEAFSGIEKAEIPDCFTGELRDYQHHGVSWLQFLRRFQLGGILSDDMGLGKTVQTLANLCIEKETKRLTTCLIIAPTSLISNWRNETERFAPDLSLLVLHGAERQQYFDQIQDYDIVLTSYALIVRDANVFSHHRFHYLILDESQKIKNHKTKAASILQQIDADYKLCLTGTPMENHLGELWSQLHFLMPGFLGNEKYFNQHYRRPIEKRRDHQRQTALKRRIAPILLRRTKDLVASELPEKTEIVQSVALSGAQRDLYETIRLMMDKRVRKEIASKGMARSHIMILDALLKLRQVCCHPGLLKLKAAKGVKDSAKLELLMTMLPELVEEGRKILLFSQFTSMLAVIESELNSRELDYVKLTGSTKDRETPIRQFQEDQKPIFLISLKAGGVGLNLTAADTVIHYDPWWNPAVEDQATDRAHRIGQDKPVFVYKFVTENTVESKILDMQERKRLLAAQTLTKKGKSTTGLTEEDLRELFSPLTR